MYPRQPVVVVAVVVFWFVVVVALLCFCFCLFFFLFFDGSPGTAGLVTQHVYLAFGCENTQTRTAASTSDASEAKYTESVFLHYSGANLNLCLTNAKVKRDT